MDGRKKAETRKGSRRGIKRVKDECIKEFFFEKLIMLVHQKVTTRPYDVIRLSVSVTVTALLSC